MAQQKVWDGTKLITVGPDGQPLPDLITAPGAQTPGSLIGGPTRPGSNEPALATKEDALALALKGAGLASSFIPGPGWAGAAARIGLPTLFGAGADMVEGDDPSVGVGLNTGFGLASEFLPAPIRAIFNRVGLRLGGIKGEVKPILGALEREDVALGAEKPIARRLASQAQAERNLEASLTPEMSLTDFEGYNPASSTPVTQPNVKLPISLQQAAKDREAEFIREQALRKSGLNAGDKVGSQKVQRRRIADTTLTAKDLGELRRSKMGAVQQGLEDATFQGRKWAPDQNPTVLDDAAMAERAQYMEQAIAHAAGKEEELLALWKQLEDLDLINTTNRAFTRGGGILTSAGELGSRGGLASGTLKNTSAAFGVPPQNQQGLLTLLLMSILGPRGASTTGRALADVVKSLPVLGRSADAAEDAARMNNKVQRRQPGGGR